ncbi:MAG: hypothetical protein ABSA39_21935 [Edaphobacter sp.]
MPGIPKDIIGIVFGTENIPEEELPNRVTDEIVFKLMGRLDDL